MGEIRVLESISDEDYAIVQKAYNDELTKPTSDPTRNVWGAVIKASRSRVEAELDEAGTILGKICVAGTLQPGEELKDAPYHAAMKSMLDMVEQRNMFYEQNKVLREALALLERYAPLSGDMALMIRASQSGGEEAHERANRLIDFYQHLDEAHDKAVAALNSGERRSDYDDREIVRLEDGSQY